MLLIWNFIRGYVTFEVHGFSVERFLNLAVYRGIYLWDVRSLEDCARIKVSVKGFKSLRTCAKKTASKMKIIERRGLPFFIFKYRRRKILLAGIVIFVACVYTLSMFVWLVEISGNDRIKIEEITMFLEENGVNSGVFKYIDDKQLERDMMISFPDISWVDVAVKGTKVTVKLTEILPRQEIIDKDTPVNVVAKKNGVIVSAATSTGTPEVKPGDVVSKGDILVKGELLIGSEDTGFRSEYVHAVSKVFARVFYDVRLTLPLDYEVKKLTGNKKSGWNVSVFGWCFNIYQPKNLFESFERKNESRQLGAGGNYPLPLIWTKSEYAEFKIEKRRYSIDEAKALAEKMISERLLSEFEVGGEVVDQQIDFSVGTDEINVSALITTIERIDVQEPFVDEPVH